MKPNAPIRRVGGVDITCGFIVTCFNIPTRIMYACLENLLQKVAQIWSKLESPPPGGEVLVAAGLGGLDFETDLENIIYIMKEGD